MTQTIYLQRIHLDLIGGIAGDMFVAALADTFPDLVPGLLIEVNKLPLPVGMEIQVVRFQDMSLCGCRFAVRESTTLVADHHAHAAGHNHHHDTHIHAHTQHATITAILRDAPLQNPVREHALAMFALLAEAEAQVHGITPDKVVFHEVGAWDSIIDFVAAAYFIDALSPTQWTCSSIPIGSGRIRCAHGILPVPAPATTLLLRGLQVIDDGIPGERVTPTGAAILKHLLAGNETTDHATSLEVGSSGNGFGLKTLPGLSNVLRCIAYTLPTAEYARADQDNVAVATFEIDDQTAEDLSISIDRIRNATGVLDVFQAPVFGKKGRMMIQVQILIRPAYVDAVVELCFLETSTLGLRLSHVARKLVPRSMSTYQEPQMRVKLAYRPGGQVTAKAEIDDLARILGGKSERDEARRITEAKATKRNCGE